MAFLRRSFAVFALGAGMGVAGLGGFAAAADLPNTKEAPPPPPPPSWFSTITVNGEVEAGITGNTNYQPSGLNWGQLFTDKADEPLLNQALLTVQRPTGSTGYDVGFAVQLLYGSDARYVHFLGECDYCINSLYQFTPTEAYISAHTPWITDGGIDFKLGQWPTLEGAETIEPSANLFYSHSYIFNYPEPFEDTGLLAITHINPTVDIYTAITSGQQTTLDPYIGDNNDAPAFEGGIGLNKLFGGSVTVLATTHIGPENAYLQPVGPPNPAANHALNYENDLVVTWNATKTITLIGEGNYTRNDLTNSDTYGAVGYISYQTQWDWLKINGRAEVFRDDGPSTYVSAYPGYFDFVNVEHGFPNTAIFGPPTTYLELTAGLNITPTVPSGIPFVKGIIFRPEVRYDSSLSGTTPFGLVNTGFNPATGTGSGFGTRSDQVTVAGDIIVKF